MAGFKMHITTSTVCGVAYGAAGYHFGIPLADCLLAGTLCSVGGMLPDLDSDSGVPLREAVAFTAAIVPMMMIHRFEQFQLPHEIMVVAGILIYVSIRFGLAEVFRRYTVHRGMWHSLPAAASAGVFTFLVCQCNELDLRIYRSMGVVVGFLSHLVLDEIWSIEVKRGKMRLKKSFGTALKFWTTKGMWPNVSTYGKLVILVALAISDPMLSHHIEPQQAEAMRMADSWWTEHVEGERAASRLNDVLNR